MVLLMPIQIQQMMLLTFLMNDVKEIGTIKIYSIEGQILAEHKTNPCRK